MCHTASLTLGIPFFVEWNCLAFVPLPLFNPASITTRVMNVFEVLDLLEEDEEPLPGRVFRDRLMPYHGGIEDME